MFAKIWSYLTDLRLMASLMTATAVAMTLVSLAIPFLKSDLFLRRLKGIAAERARLKSKAQNTDAARRLRRTSKGYMKTVVDRLSLDQWLGLEDARIKLMQAGFRGAHAEVTFLYFRLVCAVSFGVLSAAYFFLITNWDFVIKAGGVLVGVYVGLKAPEVYVDNKRTKRQESMRLAFPDALDMLLICVEAGISVEQAFQKVAQEIFSQSVPLAEELSLTNAELSYLPDRTQAYANLGQRTGLDIAKQVVLALSQAEKYGTPISQALRSCANESRAMRMLAAEKKAAALPPKLTVPMIAFFLPVLFAVIMGPVALQAMGFFATKATPTIPQVGRSR